MRNTILALLGLASLFIGFILNIIMPGLRYYAWGILALGGVLLILAVILDYKAVRGALGSRRGKFGIGVVVSISLFSGIVLLANAISVRAYHRFDLTGLAQFTLTSQTKEVLADLEQPVEVVNFYTPAVQVGVAEYASYLLTEYQNYTDKLSVRNIDPEVNPDQARQYKVDQFGATYGVTVFRSESGERQVYGPQISVEAEHAFTSAILEVTGTKQRKVYFLTGHGEGNVSTDYSDARSGLRDNLFRVDTIDLLLSSGIPEDAAAIILAGPRQALGTSELEILVKYLKEGGRLLVLLNPDPPEQLKQFLSAWWINIEDGTAIDPSSHVSPDKDTPLVPRNRNQFGLTETYFPGATVIFPQETVPENVEMAPLVWTSQDSWLEKQFSSGEEPVFDDQIDIKGSMALGVIIAVTPESRANEPAATRLVVIGDSDFASNAHFRNGDNRDLFLTSVNWLTVGEEIISVDRKVLPVRRLILDLEEARFLHISSIGLLPLLLLIAGGVLWWRRR